jgi:hypothetical protein
MLDTPVLKPCPVCGEETEYYELECNEPFTAPAPLAWKAFRIWGAYGTDKETLHQQGNLIHFRLGNTTRLVNMLRFEQDEWFKKIESVRAKRETCYQEGCSKVGEPCFTIFEPDEPIGFYCDDHKYQNGCCPGCNQFLAGFESFDFSETGYCEGCESQMEIEHDDWDDDDSFEDDYE